MEMKWQIRKCVQDGRERKEDGTFCRQPFYVDKTVNSGSDWESDVIFPNKFI